MKTTTKNYFAFNTKSNSHINLNNYRMPIPHHPEKNIKFSNMNNSAHMLNQYGTNVHFSDKKFGIPKSPNINNNMG
jgi:hypothetical protein